MRVATRAGWMQPVDLCADIPARGVFGTGKAAAFGIGSSLQVETSRNGHQWVVRLEKAELEAAGKEGRKPQIKVLENGTRTTALTQRTPRAQTKDHED